MGTLVDLLVGSSIMICVVIGVAFLIWLCFPNTRYIRLIHDIVVIMLKMTLVFSTLLYSGICVTSLISKIVSFVF